MMKEVFILAIIYHNNNNKRHLNHNKGVIQKIGYKEVILEVEGIEVLIMEG
jgi:hypothetical protein